MVAIVIWLPIAGGGCGDGSPGGSPTVGEAPSGAVSPAATVGMSRLELAAYGEGHALDATLLPTGGGHAIQLTLASLADRPMPWWWTPPQAGIGSELAPTLKIAMLTDANLAGERGGGEAFAAPQNGWGVGYERRMWWRTMPETWSSRSGETVAEQSGRSIGLAVSRPLGEKVEASFGYHRTLSDDLDPDLNPAGSEQSLFLKLGWSF